MTRLATITIAAVLATGFAAPAWAQEHDRRVEIEPYIEAGQVLTANLQNGDALTYSSAAAGVDVSIQSRRVTVQLAYKYERRFSYDDRMDDESVHSGIATVRAKVAPGFTMEAGALAARSRADSRGAAPGNLTPNAANTSQIYSAYVGPNVSTHAGPVFVNGAYRFGYTKAESPKVPSTIAGAPPLDVFDESKVHVATASAGVKAGEVLPVGVTVSGAYTREDASQLDQRYEGKYARGDVVLPVAPTLAVTAGVGYEKIKLSQRDAKLDADGEPVLDGAGRFVTDTSSPRRLGYDFDGLFWDAGVIWRPSQRTMLEAHVGKRYGSVSYTGNLSWRMRSDAQLQVSVYDSIESYGRQLNGGLASLPDSFATTDNAFGNQGGCVFGTGGSGAGACFSPVLASATTSNYRARGVTGILSVNRGRSTMGFGAGYQRRSYIAPDTGTGFSMNGRWDETYFAQAFIDRDLTPTSGIQADAFAAYFRSDLPGATSVYGWGADAAYTHRFGKLSATLAAGVYGSEGQVDQDQNEAAAQALLALRYGF